MNGSIPFGFIANFHKYFNRPITLFDQATKFYQGFSGQESQTFVVFGNFDRLSFQPVLSFPEYRKKVSLGYKWIGNRQSVMLYSLDWNPNQANQEQDGKRFGFKTKNGEPMNIFGMVDQNGIFSDFQHDYLIVSMFYVSGAAKASVKGYREFLSNCKDAILAVVDVYNQGMDEKNMVHCEVFGTFSSAEIAVIWTANNYADILYLIDNLRFMELVGFQNNQDRHKEPCRVFISSHTFIGLTKQSEAMFDAQKTGGAQINLTGRFSAVGDSPEKTGFQAIEDYVTNMLAGFPESPDSARITAMFSAGEYDLIVPVEPGALPRIFNSKSSNETEYGSEKVYNLDVHNREFCRTFFSSTTRLFYTERDIVSLKERMQNAFQRKECGGQGLLYLEIPEQSQSDAFNTEILNIFDRIKRPNQTLQEEEDGGNQKPNNNIQILFSSLREKIASLSPTTSDYVSTLDLIFSDYIQCGTSTVDHLWVNDFDAQFETVLKILNACKVDKEEIENPENKYFTPNQFLEIVQQIFAVLQQQIYHIMDSSNLFFEEPRSHFSYTGQYDLLMHAYYGIAKCLIERIYSPRRPQSKLTPVINFASVSTMKSKLYIVSAEENDPDRLLEIRFPFDALYSLDHYIPMLIHELYHYATPIDRDVRNRYYGCILLTMLYTKMFETGLENKIPDVIKNTALSNSYEMADESTLKKASDLLSTYARTAIGDYFQDAMGLNDSWEGKHNEYKRRKDVFINWLYKILEAGEIGALSYPVELASELRNAISQNCQREDWKDFLAHLNGINLLAVQKLVDGCKAFLGFFGLDDKNFGLDDKKQYNALLVQHIAKTFQPTLQTLDEIFPDVAMITLGKMDAVGYLLHFSIHQNSEVRKPINVTPQTIIRIGCILEWIFGDHDALETLEARLEKLGSQRDRFQSFYQAAVQNSEDLNHVTATTWFDYYMKTYEQYLQYYSYFTPLLIGLIRETYLPCLKAEHHLEHMNALQMMCAEYYHLLDRYGKDSSQLQKHLFQHIINLVQAFHLQTKLNQMVYQKPEASIGQGRKGETPSIHNKQTIYSTAFPYNRVRRLSKCSELVHQLNGMVQQLRNNHGFVFGENSPCSIWYRGCRNANFDILPSIMVHFADKVNLKAPFDGRNHIGTLIEFQKHLLEEFRFRADGAPEMLNNSRYMDVDYLTLMQHYRQYTGLLDWSEDAFSSLYFALEKYIDDEKEDEDSRDDPAAVYLLDPMLYNRARWMLMREELCASCEELDNCRAENRPLCRKPDKIGTILERKYLSLIDNKPEFIPNISIPSNHYRYARVFLDAGESRADENIYIVTCSPSKLTLKEALLHKERLHLPVAVYTSRLNPRIRAQSGMFMAYNLNALPAWNPNDTDNTNENSKTALFHYLALETIQDYFLELFPKEREFLLKLQIDANIKQQLGIELRRLGLNRYRIYPELEQLKQK